MELISEVRPLDREEQRMKMERILIEYGQSGLASLPFEEIQRRFKKLPGPPYIITREDQIPHKSRLSGWGTA